MIGYFSKETASDLIKLGVYQIIGGLIGVAFLIRLIIQTTGFNEITILFDLIIGIFFCYSILSGWMCLKFNKNALILSLINQCFQLPALYISGLSFVYVAGFHLDIGIDLTESLKINFDAGLSTFNLYIRMQSSAVLFKFNLIAFYLVYWIEKLRQQVKLEDAIRESDSIGEDQKQASQ